MSLRGKRFDVKAAKVNDNDVYIFKCNVRMVRRKKIESALKINNFAFLICVIMQCERRKFRTIIADPDGVKVAHDVRLGITFTF